jgi:hypothetical protein
LDLNIVAMDLHKGLNNVTMGILITMMDVVTPVLHKIVEMVLWIKQMKAAIMDHEMDRYVQRVTDQPVVIALLAVR